MDSPAVERKSEVDEIFKDDNSSSSSEEDYDENDVRMWNAEYERSGDYDFDFTRIGRYKNQKPTDFVGQMCKAAIKKYNNDKGTNLEFVRANFHPSAGFTFCISFEAKDASDQLKPFHVRVRYLLEEFLVCLVNPAKP